MIIAGAAVIMLILDRFPVLVWLGAMLLGWIAGEVIVSDPVIEPFLHRLFDGRIALTIDGTSALFGIAPHISLDGRLIELLAAMLGAIVVLVAGAIWRRRKPIMISRPLRQLDMKTCSRLMPLPSRTWTMPRAIVRRKKRWWTRRNST